MADFGPKWGGSIITLKFSAQNPLIVKVFNTNSYIFNIVKSFLTALLSCKVKSFHGMWRCGLRVPWRRWKWIV